MKRFTYTVTDAEGIHARPAGLLVKEVKKYQSSVTIDKNGKAINALKLIALMSLGVKGGETITVTVEGPDEEEAAASLKSFLSENL